jgi:hypothetical protein
MGKISNSVIGIVQNVIDQVVEKTESQNENEVF